MVTDKPYVDIEIFPCAGGIAEGFRRAGVTFDYAFEIDPTHCASYAANLGHRPICMDARDLLRMARDGWRPGKPLRMLVADPPCTPWSRAGKRLGTADDRDMLAITCQIIAWLRPEVYLIGNVPGLDDGTNLSVVQKHIGALSSHGYCTADFTRIDAANLGVPQHRVRPFWFGHLHGPCIQWPEPTHGEPEICEHPTLPGVHRLLPWVSCEQALRHLAPERLGRPVTLRKRGQNGIQHGSAPESPARVVGTSNLSDGNVLLPLDAPRSNKRGMRKRDIGRVPQAERARSGDRPGATITSRGRAAEGHHIVLTTDMHHPASKAEEPANVVRAGSGGGANRALEWPWQRPATTVYADDRLSPPGHHPGAMLSLPNAVKISELAGTILQGFPETWKFEGKSKRVRWNQIGQAVPPIVAEAVGRAMLQQWDRTRAADGDR